MPDIVINFTTSIAVGEGYSRGSDPIAGPLESDPRDLDTLSPLSTMMSLLDNAGMIHLADLPNVRSNEGVIEPAAPSAIEPAVSQRKAQGRAAQPEPVIVDTSNDGNEEPHDVSAAAAALLDLAGSGPNVDNAGAETVMIMSVKAALRDRKDETTTAMTAELTQMEVMKVWHGVNTADLNPQERRAIISSKMFLKDKYLASGVFDKFKARLVAGGHLQDKTLYENLSSPTAALTSVFTTAAIAAKECRERVIIDIGGAFLNADMAPTGVHVHMRLNKIMTDMLVEIDDVNREFVNKDGTMVVRLDKALYGCVEASNLWYNDLRGKLVSNGFLLNPYDKCVFNKVGASGHQVTVVVHVDDLFVTCFSHSDIEAFCKYLKTVYPETKETRGVIIDYIGMTFDFSTVGEVKVTMDNCVNDIISECGVTDVRTTPATAKLFDIRDAPRASEEDQKYFRTYVAKMLYVAKRAKPECLVAVAFLSTRVNVCDVDDMAKLYRLLGYVVGTRERGIVFKIGEQMTVNVFIDAAHGVHRSSGKSHTGCVVIIGEQGPVYAKSTKQKIVTKSSTEAELVGLSDTASQGIHTRRFLVAQGYDIGPVKIHQDNMSCIALMKRGCPGSDKSRHIEIRYFWLAERVANGEVVIEHLCTERMFANILTKPMQGPQFQDERQGLTNWTSSN